VSKIKGTYPRVQVPPGPGVPVNFARFENLVDAWIYLLRGWPPPDNFIPSHLIPEHLEFLTQEIKEHWQARAQYFRSQEQNKNGSTQSVPALAFPKNQTEALTNAERYATEEFLFRETQQHYYAAILQALKCPRTICSDLPDEVKRPIIELGLSVNLVDGLIYSYGRIGEVSKSAIRARKFDDRTSNPFAGKVLLLLPSTGVVAESILFSAHNDTSHRGQNWTINETRDRYWFQTPSALAKRIKRHCKTCQRLNSKPYVTEPGGLPSMRTEKTYVFQHTGLDFCSIRLKPKIKKVPDTFQSLLNICIFTCMTTRAVHFELAHDMTAEDFARVFRTFCDSERIIPEIVLSDNGTNFIPVADSLRFVPHLDGEKLFPKVQWRLLPANAPNWGGFYERLNDTLKKMFMSTFPKLAFKSPLHIQSALKQIECRMNKRPLWTISMDRDDPEMICPANFLVVAPDGNLGPPGQQTIDQLKTIAVAQQRKVESMWTQFFSSYVAALRVQKRWNYKAGPDLKVGDFVVLHNKVIAKTRWPMARIRTIIRDGTYGRIKAVYVDSYIADKVNTKLKNSLFGVHRTHKSLTENEFEQVKGFFKPLERPVPIDNIYPYERFGEDIPIERQFPPVQHSSVATCWNTDEYVQAHIITQKREKQTHSPARTISQIHAYTTMFQEYC
jgi:hypothetical protein